MAAVIMRTRLTLPVIVAALLLLAVLGAARPLGGDGWVVPDGSASIVQAIRRLYLQQLGGPGPSCGTNSPNNGCPP